MRWLAIPVAAVTSMVNLCAFGNPIMVVNDVYAEQVPGTAHVQITRTYSSGGPSTTEVKRDGSTITISFENTSGGSRDLGSGITSLSMHLGCDCSVPVGDHSYVVAGMTVPVTVVDAATATGTPRSPSADCASKCESSVVVPTATGGASGTGGGTGTTGGASGTGGGTGTTGGATGLGSGASDSSSAPQDNNDSSGCAIAGRASGFLPIGILLTLGLLGFCRRK
jgi:hypothetical protein